MASSNHYQSTQQSSGGNSSGVSGQGMHMKNVGYNQGGPPMDGFYCGKQGDPSKTINVSQCKNEMCPLKEIIKKQ